MAIHNNTPIWLQFRKEYIDDNFPNLVAYLQENIASLFSKKRDSSEKHLGIAIIFAFAPMVALLIPYIFISSFITNNSFLQGYRKNTLYHYESGVMF